MIESIRNLWVSSMTATGRTEIELAPIIEKRLHEVYLNGDNWYHDDQHQVPFGEWLMFWLAQPLTPANPVDIWVDMTEHEMYEMYGYEDGGEYTEALAIAIIEAAGVTVPAEWARWDGMGEPAWLAS